MSEYKSSCPGCASAIPARTIAFELQIECPTCRMGLRVPTVYQANFLLASLALGVAAASLIGPDAHVVEITFGLAFVFALFLATTVVPLVPPKLELR